MCAVLLLWPCLPVCAIMTYLPKSLKNNLQLFRSAVALNPRYPQPPTGCGEKHATCHLFDNTGAVPYMQQLVPLCQLTTGWEHSRLAAKCTSPKKTKKPRLLRDAGELMLSCLLRKYRCCHFLFLSTGEDCTVFQKMHLYFLLLLKSE